MELRKLINLFMSSISLRTLLKPFEVIALCLTEINKSLINSQMNENSNSVALIQSSELTIDYEPKVSSSAKPTKPLASKTRKFHKKRFVMIIYKRHQQLVSKHLRAIN